MSIVETAFGETAAGPARLFMLDGAGGVRAAVSDHGARLVSLWAPDRNGDLADISLGFDAPAAYEAEGRWYGATCGRVANRIRDARFAIDGRVIDLTANAGRHHVHGGPTGFDMRLWRAELDEAANAVRFHLASPDGDEGYPGALTAIVSYRLDGRSLEIDARATTDAPTVVNLVNHAYWNLAGHGAGHIGGHLLSIHAGFFTPLDEDLVVTGEIRSVDGAPCDFRLEKRLDAAFPLRDGAGWDQNFMLDGAAGAMRSAAVLTEPTSGRRMRMETDQPGLQLFSGATLPLATGKGGAAYGPYAGVALEAQGVPGAPNIPHFPSVRLDPGVDYRSRVRLHFETC